LGKIKFKSIPFKTILKYIFIAANNIILHYPIRCRISSAIQYLKQGIIMRNKFFKLTAIASLVCLSSVASAQWTFSGGYANYNEEDSGVDINLGAIYASAGYEYTSGKMTFMPELRLGVGVADDTVFGVNVEIDSFVVASIRGQYNVTDSFGVFLQPSYGRSAVSASAGGQSASDNTTEFGFGGGATFKLSETTALEASYESFDGTDVISFGARFTF
jgi:opacity protein-like surface antigen